MTNLRIPGPTPCPDNVLEASGRQMINHRSPEFREILTRTTERLQQLFSTTNDLYILTASGTGAMEAAVVNTLSPGERVLAISIGVFGERFIQVAKAYGADVQVLTAEYGKAIDPDEVRKALKADPTITSVLVTHNETSTGVTNDLAAVSSIVKGEFNKLLLVDAVSSIGSLFCPVDGWNLDVVASGSQKGWMAPPGLAMVSLSKQAWEANEHAIIPRFYFDLAAAKQYLDRGQTPWTPAVSVFYALDAALSRLTNEGIEGIVQRHTDIAEMTRVGIKELGLKLFADEAVASNTVTAIQGPEGVDLGKLLGLLRTEYDVVLADGQGSMQGHVFRIGHLGYCSREDIHGALKALESALPKLGYRPSTASTRGN
ncbi:MAG: class V aminotransferase [SAR202 cluster bacterium Io17-Chloro-G3]|nr:MAG: class V aminotransferase [SAR202 cluster bacterium Io17-Chloro-G3]